MTKPFYFTVFTAKQLLLTGCIPLIVLTAGCTLSNCPEGASVCKKIQGEGQREDYLKLCINGNWTQYRCSGTCLNDTFCEIAEGCDIQCNNIRNNKFSVRSKKCKNDKAFAPDYICEGSCEETNDCDADYKLKSCEFDNTCVDLKSNSYKLSCLSDDTSTINDDPNDTDAPDAPIYSFKSCEYGGTCDHDKQDCCIQCYHSILIDKCNNTKLKICSDKDCKTNCVDYNYNYNDECIPGDVECLDDAMGNGILSICGPDKMWHSQVCRYGCAQDGMSCNEPKSHDECDNEGEHNCEDTQAFSVEFTCIDRHWVQNICGLNSTCDGDHCGEANTQCNEGERMCKYVDSIDSSIAVECTGDSWITHYCTYGCDGDVCRLCPNDMVACNGVCINPATSREYCGADANCENYITCDEDRECSRVEGENRYQCVCRDRAECDHACYDLRISLNHCGSCENDCTQLDGWKDGNCVDGVCRVTECASGYKLMIETHDNTEVRSCKADCEATCTDGTCINDKCFKPSSCDKDSYTPSCIDNYAVLCSTEGNTYVKDCGDIKRCSDGLCE